MSETRRYFVVKPEIAGGWGPRTVAITEAHPPQVTFLDYEFQDWFGDGILATFPCFIVREELADDLAGSGYTGFEFGVVAISKSDLFYDLKGDLKLPHFKRLLVTGKEREDDLFINGDHNLAVSDRALHVLRRHVLLQAEISDY